MGTRGGTLPFGAAAVAAVAATLAGLCATASAQVPGLPVLPIPSDPSASAAPFEGSDAQPRPIKGVPEPPQHPFMAPNERSNIHNDAYMTDVYRAPGPLGDGPETSGLFFRECASIAFDAQGRIVTICVGIERPVLALLDPRSLETLAALPLPPRNPQTAPGLFNDFTGGGYFYLDHRDRAVLPTNDRRVLEVAITDGPEFAITREQDLTAQVAAADGIVSVLPDWSGRIWFVTRSGMVGTIDRDSGEVHTQTLQEEGISNSFAVDETGGVFIVSDRALYRFDAGGAGEPVVTWRRVYPNSGIHKPGQSDAGSGATPTLMGKDLVTITDNADPMNVQVYERGAESRQDPLCSEPVFRPGASATDQSLIATNRSIVVENNYGYSGPASTMNGGVTEPGLTRVDVRRKGRDCTTVWESSERAPSLVPKLSLGNGLVYTYTKPPRDDNDDAWYLTALDFRTGETIYKRLAGVGFGHNNNWSPVTIGPDGTAYVGVLGGLAAFR